MFKLVAFTKLGQEYKNKKYSTKPKFSQINRIINRWSLAYGAHLNYKVIEVQSEEK